MDSNLVLAAINTVLEARIDFNAQGAFIGPILMIVGFFGVVGGMFMLFTGPRPIGAIFVVACVGSFGTGLHVLGEYDSRRAAFWEELRSGEDCRIVAEGIANRSVRMPDHTALALQRRCGIPAAEFVEFVEIN